MARDYLTEYFGDLSTLRGLLEYGAGSPTDDVLSMAATSACRWFERAAGQPFVPVTATRRFAGDGARVLPLDQALASITAITVDGDTIDIDTGLRGPDELGGPDGHEWLRDPRLILTEDHDLSAWPRTPYSGVPNVVIAGVWGAIDGTADSPALIAEVQWALLRAVHILAANPSDDDVIAARRWGAEKSSTAGGRSATMAAAATDGLMADVAIGRVLRSYRAPRRFRSTLRRTA